MKNVEITAVLSGQIMMGEAYENRTVLLPQDAFSPNDASTSYGNEIEKFARFQRIAR